MLSVQRIILHVGQAKAASTAFQNMAETKRDQLLEHGILFPVSVLKRRYKLDSTRTPGHLGLVVQQPGEDAREVFLGEVASHEAHTIIISIEHIFLTFDQSIQVDFATFLSSTFPNAKVELMAVLRHPLSWVPSLYYEMIMGGTCETRNIDDFLDHYEAQGVLDYAAVLDSLSQSYNATAVHVLDFSNSERPIVPAMFKVIDPSIVIFIKISLFH